MISRKSLRKFQELYKKEFGIELSNEEALEKAVRLIELYRFVYGITPEELID